MLEDTSFAIRPIDQTDEKEVWQPIGDVQKIEEKKQIFAFTCDQALYDGVKKRACARHFFRSYVQNDV